MLMRPNKDEAAVHGCQCPGDMAVRMRKVLARPWVGVRVSLAFIVVLLTHRSAIIKAEPLSQCMPWESTAMQFPANNSRMCCV